MSDSPTASFTNNQPAITLPGQAAPQPITAIPQAIETAPWLTPVTLDQTPSVGFGDRIGLATPGHAQSMLAAGKQAGIAPIFAQQSIREMARTNRQPDQVMQHAQWGALLEHWNAPHGADADHLKTHEDVDRTAAAGFTFFTIDPSDNVDQKADDYDEQTLRKHFADVQPTIDWYEKYLNQQWDLPNGTKIIFDEQSCMRCAVKYGPAINHALELANYIDSVHAKLNRPYEIELSVDETDQPTTLAEHLIIADQCLGKGMKLVSLAPRFIGELEKGVDYIGDVSALEKSLEDHAQIAQQLGPYKLSLHSGSDKLSMYPALARATQGHFHVKTAGTSYLEALRVPAQHNNDLFRRIIDFSRSRYETDRATYHVHATLNSAPPPAELPDNQKLEALYLERWPDVTPGLGFTEAGRQILHCTFGSVLTHPQLGTELQQTLAEHLDTYTHVLAEHFTKHLQSLAQGM